ncbi:MAG: hypothetical protein Q8Q24_00120 [bacterium]|nr:hypothetical protein [bacterium]
MYPAQTSLIPVQIALAKFWEVQGFSALFVDYPYWYLGTTPFHYLSGILPLFLAVLHHFLPGFSLFEIMFGVVGASWILGGLGVYLLVQALINAASNAAGTFDHAAEQNAASNAAGTFDRAAERRRIPALAAFFYLLGPIVPFLFRFSDGLYLIAFSFLPFVLLVYHRWLKSEDRRQGTEDIIQKTDDRGWKVRKIEILLCLLIAFVILLDTQIIPTLILGMATLILAEGGWKRVETKVKSSLVLLFFSFLISTLWYAPGYWWTLLGSPSFGGQALLAIIAWIGKILPIALAFTLVIVSARFFKKKNALGSFCFYWLFIFGFLTLVRFLSDPDFWLDWSSYGVELQMGIAIALGGWLGGKPEDRRQRTEDGLQKTEDGRQIIENQFSVFSLQNLFSVFRLPSSILLALYLILFIFVLNRYVLGTFQKDITQTVEYRLGNQLAKIAKPQERVFLSGTTTFWLNAFFDIPQVRGGTDQASIDPDWRKAVWEVREGATTESTERWLKALKITYLVVHTKESDEFYHDFDDPEKFEQISGLKKIYEEKGDRIYRLEK